MKPYSADPFGIQCKHNFLFFFLEQQRSLITLKSATMLRAIGGRWALSAMLSYAGNFRT